MIKRVIADALIITIAAGLLSACGSRKEKPLLDPENPTMVTIWNYYNGDQLSAFETLVNQFNDTVGLEKGIIVESVSQGSIGDLASRLIDAVNGKVGAEDVPSAAAIYAETAYILNQDEAIVPLDSYFSEEELGEYIPKFVDEGRFTDHGGLYLLPVSKSTEAFIVNTTDWSAFEQASGISAERIDCYEELTAAAEAYYRWTDEQTPDIPDDGKALYGRDSVANYMFMGTAQLGHEIFRVADDGSVSVDLDRDTFKRLWDNYYIPYVKGYFVNSGSHRSEDMKTGTILAMTGSTSGVSYISDSVVDQNDVSHNIEVAIGKSLNFKDADPKLYVQQGAGYGVMKTSKAEELAAVEFLKWFTDTDQNLAFSVGSGYSPVKLSANNVDKIKSSVSADSYKSKNMLNALLISSEVYEEGSTYTCRAFEGSKKTRDILADAMENATVQDREAVLQQIKEGVPMEEAAAAFCTEEYFDAWFQELSRQIHEVVS